jgi:hypothetical protein
VPDRRALSGVFEGLRTIDGDCQRRSLGRTEPRRLVQSFGQRASLGKKYDSPLCEPTHHLQTKKYYAYSPPPAVLCLRTAGGFGA